MYVPFKYSIYFCVSFIKVVWSGRDDCVSFICISFINVSFIGSFIVSFIYSFTVVVEVVRFGEMGVGVGEVSVVRLGEMRGEMWGLRVMGDSDRL